MTSVDSKPKKPKRPLTEEEKKKLYYEAISTIANERDEQFAGWRCMTEFCDFVNFPDDKTCSQCKIPQDRESITKARLTKLIKEFNDSIRLEFDPP